MKFRIALAALLLSLPVASSAHRMWIMPSSTVLSGDESWITVDAAVSNELFYFNHVPLRLNGMTVWQPDGTAGEVENGHTGHYRSTFDVHLTQQGTYKIGSAMRGIGGGYMLDGERHRLRRGASADDIGTLIPEGATDVRLVEMSRRNEIFVTLGVPTETVFQPTGQGLEMVPVTHPNDLVSGEEAVFRFLVDGEPAANLEIEIVPGGIRYRDAVNQIDAVTDTQGEVRVTWPEPGMYWLNASAQDENVSVPRATERRLDYVTTLEVMTP